MSGLVERDLEHEIVLVVAVALEQWTPPDDAQHKNYPVHRLIYDARTDEMRVEWHSAGYFGWNPCEHPDCHLPVFESARAALDRASASAPE